MLARVWPNRTVGSMMSRQIPFHRRTFLGSELDYLREALEWYPGQAHASFPDRVEKVLEQELVNSRVLLTPSCAAALEISGLLLNIAPATRSSSRRSLSQPALPRFSS